MAARGKKKSVSATVDHFCSITGVTTDVGEQMIEACNGDLQLAVEMHMDGNPDKMLSGKEPKATSTNSKDGEEDVRAPIPQKREILVDDAPVFVQKMITADATIGFRGRRPARSVFDGFRDFQAEARQQEQMMIQGSGSVTSKHQTLEELFRPPIDLTFKGTFASARDEGTNLNKWLMVNIQNVQEFSCQTLNRDVWSNSAVRSIVQEHFILWQVYHDSEEGRKYMQFYKVKSWPYIAILDPQTGEKLTEWNNLDHTKFCEYAAEFLSLHPSLDGSLSPPHKCLKPEQSLVDASEDAQLQAAIKASLEQEKKNTSDSFVLESPCSSKKSASPVPTKEASQPQWHKHLGSKDDPVTNLMIRFPSGSKQQLSLPCSSKLLALEEYVQEEGYSSEKYELLTNYPRRKLSELDMNLTLKDAGLFPQDTVFVQER
ncbi:UBX domain-containing protein 7 [Acanthosepion pharaonis]|uniref:UBX domain-containing protein 7 n=1 Tax=Acanthosepion pharaonis TaxID=158019 RepID=A0A812CS72_ACAPH|nr:UBX domain-containing protein 7 [Sepia pharaonis]